jgi:PAS domain S-box-containing protein
MLTLDGFASIAANVIDKSILFEKALREEREALEAKRRVEELRDYLQGLIENSADAIETTDLEGVITSWNQGAERIYGFSKQEAVGQFLPFVPPFLVDAEKGYIEQVKKGETLKDIETLRRTRSGRMIEISLTLSPIKDASGKAIGISRIARDITERKRIEKELLRKNNELTKLFFISSAMRETLDLDKLLRMVLTAVTVGDGLGFNRAMLFLVDDTGEALKGVMGVGPSTHDEAWEIWSRLSMEQKSLKALLEDIMEGPSRKDSHMDRLSCGMEIPLDAGCYLTRSVVEKRPYNVLDAFSDPASWPPLSQLTGTFAYAVVPLVSRNRVIGVLWVDNHFSKRPITERDMEFLKGFTDQMASAIENAQLFEHVARAEQELENIFESISDLVYFSDGDYRIRKINKAVVTKIGRPPEDIIGKRCYEVFHGMNEPWTKCPHHKTIMTGKSWVEEVQDRHLGGTYLISSSPLFDKAGALLGTVHLARDVSEIQKLRQKVASSERMAALGEMAAKVAHEIRNPLLSIGGFARRLEKRLDGDMKDFSRIIVEEVRRLEGILNSTLSFVKSGESEKKEVDADEFIESILMFLDPAANDKGNVLVKEVRRPLRLCINPDRFKEALLNLLTNANQATDRGRVTVRAYRTVQAPSGVPRGQVLPETVLEIEDNGAGIREEDIDRVFDPFFTTRTAGTGLGLSITKRIIGEHGGRIEVKSNVGKGTIFTIFLPTAESACPGSGRSEQAAD